jgi:hypothetical protein
LRPLVSDCPEISNMMVSKILWSILARIVKLPYYPMVSSVQYFLIKFCKLGKNYLINPITTRSDIWPIYFWILICSSWYSFPLQLFLLSSRQEWKDSRKLKYSFNPSDYDSCSVFNFFCKSKNDFVKFYILVPIILELGKYSYSRYIEIIKSENR